MKLPYVFSMLACTMLLNAFADEPIIQEQHAVVGSRPMDSDKLEKIQAQKLQQSYENNLPSNPLAPSSFATTAYYRYDGQPDFVLASAYPRNPEVNLAAFPLSCHWLTTISPDFRHITIEDGSVWEVASGDYSVLNSWRADDALFITPVTSWFISQNYYINNRTNNTYVRANLVDGPITFGRNSHWITGIDVPNGHVFLENQSVWCIDPKDAYILTDRRNNNEWALNDHIIVILHDSRTSPYDYVLINVNMNNQVHAKPY